MKPLTKEWIKKAEEDYRVAVREAKAKPGNYSAVCFHSQQAIEKYMKAVLQENKISFAKIHDLEILLKGCVKIIPVLRDYREEFIWLTAFGVEVRYPGFEAAKEDMKKAVKFIRKLRIFFKSYIRSCQRTVSSQCLQCPNQNPRGGKGFEEILKSDPENSD